MDSVKKIKLFLVYLSNLGMIFQVQHAYIRNLPRCFRE